MYKVKVQLETEMAALFWTQNVQHSVHPLMIEDVFAARVLHHLRPRLLCQGPSQAAMGDVPQFQKTVS